MKTEVYALPELDCPNCAMKVERQVGRIKGLNEVTVDFVHKKMIVEFEGESRKEQIIQAVKKVEPDIRIVEVTDKKEAAPHSSLPSESQKYEHHHKHSDCGEDHEHHHGEEECGCGHDHEHHHKYCDCGEDHEHHHEDEECGCGHNHEALPEVDHSTMKGELKLRLAGLDCANCAAKIERAVNVLPQVREASVTFSTQTLLVDAKPSVNRTELIAAIAEVVKKLEPEVDVVEMKAGAKNAEPEAAQPGFFRQNARLLAGIVFLIAGIFLQEQSYVVLIFLISFLLIGGEVVYNAIRNVFQGEWFDETFLMSVATIGAFAIGDYVEGVAVMLFYQIGELFQSYAVNRSRKSIGSLMNIRADYATVLREGKELRVDPESVAIGETILIKPGERVPLDGILTEGTTSLDTRDRKSVV